MPYRRLATPLMILALAAAPGPRADAGPEESVVLITATLRLPNPIRPWVKQNPVEVRGAGVVIEGNRILTNYHIINYASEVTVRDGRGGDAYEARVESFGPAIDLATLALEDESFFEGARPIPRAGGRPVANAPVELHGFPVGGNGPAITQGVISRVDFAPYAATFEGMRIQVDAAVNPGNSGGPALSGGAMVGLTFGQLGGAENVGYVIPNEEIDAYLEDVKDGRHDGKPRFEANFQALENEALRARLGLDRATRGIMATRQVDAAGSLREFDVLTHVGDQALDNEGNVRVDAGLRLPFTALIPRLSRDGALAVRLIREGKTLEVAVPLAVGDDRLIKPYSNRYPSYFVVGPLVFSPVMHEAVPIYLRLNPIAFVDSPLVSRRDDDVAFPDEELVVVTSPLLGHKVAKGYDEPFGLVVDDIDGVAVRNLRHLVELFRDGQGPFVTLRFRGGLTPTLVFRRRDLEAATEEVMVENGIARRGSEDALAVWNAKGVPQP